MSSLNNLLTTICNAPPNEIDPTMVTKIKRLIGCHPEIVATELKEIKVECEAGELCSEFAMFVISETINIAEMKS